MAALDSRVLVEDEKRKLRESYELAFGDASELQDGLVTMGSPIGCALQGKGLGEQTMLKLATTIRRLMIVELVTIHERSTECLA